MRAKEFIEESALKELVKELPTLAKHDYDTIDSLLRKIARKHKITDKALEHLFRKKFKKTPHHWVDGKLDEALPGGASRNVRRTKSKILHYLNRVADRVKVRNRDSDEPPSDGSRLFVSFYNATKPAEMNKEYTLTDIFKMPEIDKSLLYILGPLFREDADISDLHEDVQQNLDIEAEVQKFADWAKRRCHVKGPVKIELSQDTEDAQTNHHTGRHTEGSDTIWVYAKNRNLVDILRTVFHEIVHVRQSELNMIKPGDSYPGSPIEAMADMLAGKYIKIYGEKNHHIFQ